MPSNRNRPCPCGSGKKYKHCHGAVVSRQPYRFVDVDGTHYLATNNKLEDDMSKKTKKPKIVMRSPIAFAAKIGLGVAVLVGCLMLAALAGKIAGGTADWWLIGPLLAWMFGTALRFVLIAFGAIGLLTTIFSYIVFGDWCPVTHQDFDKSNNKEQYPNSGGKPIPED